jgi:transposase
MDARRLSQHSAIDEDDFSVVIVKLQAEIDALKKQNTTLRIERDHLKEQLSARVRQLFAARSEQRSEQQALVFNEAEVTVEAEPEKTEEPTAPVAAHSRKKPGRKPLDPKLPREVIRYELPPAERVCPHDGTALREIGVEASEQLDIIPAQARVIRHERVKYACPCCEQGVKTAPAPKLLLPKSLLTSNAMAWVAVSKYADGLPLYRQTVLLSRFGGETARNTLAVSVVRVGGAVQPLINLMRERQWESPVIHVDETELQVLKEKGRPAQRKSYLWVLSSDSGPPVRLFTYAPSRSAQTAAELLEGASGALVSDGYEAYDRVAVLKGLVHLGCWVHARRRFIEAEAALPAEGRAPDHPATRMVALIGKLYHVEAKAKETSPDVRLRMRHEHSVPILDRIEALLVDTLPTVAPQSPLGKALHYLQSQWPKLVRFLEDARYPLDNNAAENAIRPFVIGRKNWLFADTVKGAQASANLYSLIETAKANGIEPYRYLAHVFRALPYAETVEHLEALLPWNVKLA